MVSSTQVAQGVESPAEDPIQACLRSFQEMVEAANNSSYEYRMQVSPAEWSDEVNSIVYAFLVQQITDARIEQLERFRVWASQSGAFDIGLVSVDARLNGCELWLREEIDTLLEDLKKATGEIKTALSQDPAEGSVVIEPSETMKDKTDNTIGIQEMYGGRTELQQLQGWMKYLVDNIYYCNV